MWSNVTAQAATFDRCLLQFSDHWSHVDLQQATFTDSRLTLDQEADALGECGPLSHFDLTGATFTGCTLTGLHFDSSCDLTGVTFAGCTFDSVYLLGVDLSGVTFDRCTFTEVEVCAVDLRQATFTDCSGSLWRDTSSDAELSDAELQQSQATVGVWQATQLTGVTSQGAAVRTLVSRGVQVVDSDEVALGVGSEACERCWSQNCDGSCVHGDQVDLCDRMRAAGVPDALLPAVEVVEVDQGDADADSDADADPSDFDPSDFDWGDPDPDSDADADLF